MMKMPLIKKRDGNLPNKNSPDHLLLPCLFFIHAQIPVEKINELVEDLKLKFYKRYDHLNPIIEIACMFSQNVSLPISEREKMLTFILKAPKQEKRENAKLFNRRVDEYRNKQQKWITACRDLLFFGQGEELVNVQKVEDLLEAHKKTCQKIFGVKGEHVHKFIDGFKSKRYPNVLFTYAARLQNLTDEEKAPLIELLGKFVNEYLEGSFLSERYNLSNNMHLNTVFKDNEELLNKWRAPFEIDLAPNARLDQDSSINPYIAVRVAMIRSIDHHHLGVDQEHRYPSILLALRNDEPAAIQQLSRDYRISLNPFEGKLN